MSVHWLRTLAILGMMLAGGGAAAQDATSAEAIVRALISEPTQPTTRSLRGVNVVESADTQPPSIDLRIGFAFDSSELTTEGALLVRRLGNALGDARLADIKVTIIGHTDAKGSHEYNQKLSERRAAAVRDALIFHYHVDAERLSAAGMGETQPAWPADPENEMNRRVEVRRLLN